MKYAFLLIGVVLFPAIYGQTGELEHFRMYYNETEVRKYIERAYTDVDVQPYSTEAFDQIRSGSVGESFFDPSFGRRWTFIFDGGHTIMNSERNAWNADTSLFFLEAGTGSNFRKIALFDGKTADYLRTVTVRNMSKTGSSLPSLRWMPGDPDGLFYIHANRIYAYSISADTTVVYQEFASFQSTQSKIAGGDGNEVDPFGDFLIGNKGSDCFVYNFFEKKVVRIQDGQRYYFDPGSPFPTIDLGAIDYATAFAGFIFELDEDGGGTLIRDYNGMEKQTLYRRTPHMDPTFFRHEGVLYPGIYVRYNAADAGHYQGKGLDSEERRCYFHAFDPGQPAELVRFTMDLWPSTNLGSGGQVSSNRMDGSTGILSVHGPALYDLPWEPRFGEVYEKAFNDRDAKVSRRIAHHYIGYESDYPSSAYQPEGWNSPDGTFVVIKTLWGWYKVDLFTERMTPEEIHAYLEGPPPVTFELSVQNGKGSGPCVEGSLRIISADKPAYGYVFDQWTGDVETIQDVYGAQTTLTMPGNDISVEAIYKEAPHYELNISVAGSGSVMTNPAGGSFLQGTGVALIPVESGEATFIRWEGDLSGSQNPAFVSMDSSIGVTAVFSDAVTGQDAPELMDNGFYPLGKMAGDIYRFRVELSGTSDLNLEIFHMNGSVVGHGEWKEVPPGKTDIACKIMGRVQGPLIARLSGDEFVKVLKFVDL